MQTSLHEWPSGYVGVDSFVMTKLILGQCVREAQRRMVQSQESRFIPALDHGVCKSDTILSAIKTSLRSSIERLEQSNKNDSTTWSETVQSLIVDPCLYPFCFGRTRYRVSAMSKIEDSIRLCGKGWSRSLLQQEESGSLSGKDCYAINNAWSTKYQWLPSDIEFDEHTDEAR